MNEYHHVAVRVTLIVPLYITHVAGVQLFQAEMFSRQQILHSIISDGQRMLEQGQVDDR